MAALDSVVAHRQLTAKEDGIEAIPVLLALESPLADDTIGLAATPSTTKEDLGDRAINEGFLWPPLWLPYRDRSGLPNHLRLAACP